MLCCCLGLAPNTSFAAMKGLNVVEGTPNSSPIRIALAPPRLKPTVSSGFPYLEITSFIWLRAWFICLIWFVGTPTPIPASVIKS